MTHLTRWSIALLIVLSVGALAAGEEPDTETADDIAAEQAHTHRIEHAADLVEQSAMWSPMR